MTDVRVASAKAEKSTADGTWQVEVTSALPTAALPTEPASPPSPAPSRKLRPRATDSPSSSTASCGATLS